MTTLPALPWLDDYRALTTAVGLVDCGDRTLLELAGGDRVKFLQGFCTNHVARLATDEACEAFVTSVQGKILGHVEIVARTDRLRVETVAGQAERLQRHLDRYLIREDVTICDASSQRRQWLLAGPQAAELAARAGLAHQPEVFVRRVPWLAVDALLVDVPRQAWPRWGDELERQGARRVAAEVFDAARIEAGWPLYGRDITDQNLPQEVGRDRQAIHFNKGCYLGQETVARIDALGHVNRLLVLVRWNGPVPPPAGEVLSASGAAAGEVTSSCYSPRYGSALSLAYLRRTLTSPGTRVESSIDPGQVVALSAS